jgi:hypothetical protein
MLQVRRRVGVGLEIDPGWAIQADLGRVVFAGLGSPWLGTGYFRWSETASRCDGSPDHLPSPVPRDVAPHTILLCQVPN